MLIDIIAAGVFLICLVAIIVIIARKFPTLAAIRPNATSDRSAERKTTIIEERLRRKFSGWWGRVATGSQPMLKNVTGAGQRLQKKLVDLEHEYKVRSLPVLLNRRQQKKVADEINSILEQARTFAADGELHAAEEKALQVVRLEPRSVPAFTFLGELYMDMKEYQHAKEVYRYLLKLTGDADAIYEHMAEADIADGQLTNAKAELGKAVELNGQNMNYHLELAQVERQLGEWAEAFASIQEAARLEPNHPKVLDELIEISLGYNKKEFARDAIAKVKTKNPDNSKISEWEERVAAL